MPKRCHGSDRSERGFPINCEARLARRAMPPIAGALPSDSSRSDLAVKADAALRSGASFLDSIGGYPFPAAAGRDFNRTDIDFQLVRDQISVGRT